jgi:phenylalanyl-tRNA synthetase beta chain
MDLVEEIALGYGIENIQPTLSSLKTLGNQNLFSLKMQSISSLMLGLGFMEVVNSSLTSKRILYELSNRDSTSNYLVMNSKSEEHDTLRDNILTGLINNLSNNIHEPYPQKLFETGTVFSKGNPIHEDTHLACINANKDANFSEMKSILQSLLKISFNIEFKTKSSSHAPFHKGRTADVIVNGRSCGIIGEIDPEIKENFKIRVPLVGFEIKLSGLIFN